MSAAVGAPAGIYNVCDDEPILFRDYLQAVATAAGAKQPIHLPGFLGKIMFGQVWSYFSRSQRVSNAKLKHLTGWEPRMKSAVEGWPAVAAALAGKSALDGSPKVA